MTTNQELRYLARLYLRFWSTFPPNVEPDNRAVWLSFFQEANMTISEIAEFWLESTFLEKYKKIGGYYQEQLDEEETLSDKQEANDERRIQSAG